MKELNLERRKTVGGGGHFNCGIYLYILKVAPLNVMDAEMHLSVHPPECLFAIIPSHYIFYCISLPSSFQSFSDIQHQKLHCFILDFTNSNQIIVKQNYLIRKAVNCFGDCHGYV